MSSSLKETVSERKYSKVVIFEAIVISGILWNALYHKVMILPLLY